MNAALPQPPRLVLRVAFAGNRKLPANITALDTALDRVLRSIAQTLAMIAARDAPGAIVRYDRSLPPLLRLVTGLAEGADDRAAEALLKISDTDQPVATELAAVLPCDPDAYRAAREEFFRARFDRLTAICAYILALDGNLDKPDPDTDFARLRRKRAYRAQGAFLLRQADLLIAVVDPGAQGKAGGTLETVASALDLGMSVVFVDAAGAAPRFAEPGTDLELLLVDPAPPPWEEALHACVARIVAGPESDPAQTRPKDEVLTTEYFDRPRLPPQELGADGQWRRRPSRRERAWSLFEGWFSRGKTKSFDTPPPWTRWRDRATRLNYHYAGLYRGAFLLNYLLATTAVLLAAAGLFVLAIASGDPHGRPPWLWWLLVALALCELGIVAWILRNTRRAHREDWNDKAVDLRYLAERLRAAAFLAPIGSARPPAAQPPPHAARALRQSAADWLFDAIVRHVPPGAAHAPPATAGAAATGTVPPIIRIDDNTVRAALEGVRDRWLMPQAEYHRSTAATMGRMHRFLGRAGVVLSLAVVACVAFDAILLAAKALHWPPASLLGTAPWLTPVLMLLAAVLPAAVASANAVRFQSECRRLAERSAAMVAVVQGRDGASGRRGEVDRLLARIDQAAADPGTDPRAWSLNALWLIEDIAADFAHEVADWSVLYAKELPEPG
jgi:hypothetical protein